MVKKAVEPEPWRLKIALALGRSVSSSEGEPGGMPKPRKSSEVSVVIDPDEDEGQEGQRRHHRIRQHMPPHDGAVVDAEGARGPHIFEIAGAQELGTHDADEAHPGEQQHDAEQHEEAGRPGWRR